MADLPERIRRALACDRCSCLSCGREGCGEMHDHVCTHGEHCVETRARLRARVAKLKGLLRAQMAAGGANG